MRESWSTSSEVRAARDFISFSQLVSRSVASLKWNTPVCSLFSWNWRCTASCWAFANDSSSLRDLLFSAAMVTSAFSTTPFRLTTFSSSPRRFSFAFSSSSLSWRTSSSSLSAAMRELSLDPALCTDSSFRWLPSELWGETELRPLRDRSLGSGDRYLPALPLGLLPRLAGLLPLPGGLQRIGVAERLRCGGGDRVRWWIRSRDGGERRRIRSLMSRDLKSRSRSRNPNPFKFFRTSLTRMVRPSICPPSMSRIAIVAERGLVNDTNPKPRDSPLSRSYTIFTETTSPNSMNAFFTVSSLLSYDSPPTYTEFTSSISTTLSQVVDREILDNSDPLRRWPHEGESLTWGEPYIGCSLPAGRSNILTECNHIVLLAINAGLPARNALLPVAHTTAPLPRAQKPQPQAPNSKWPCSQQPPRNARPLRRSSLQRYLRPPRNLKPQLQTSSRDQTLAAKTESPPLKLALAKPPFRATAEQLHPSPRYRRTIPPRQWKTPQTLKGPR
ncbi:hypothetical protein KC19_1G264300 [Ceratodon purpureus]|uniref:Uncharacterized protein n=1 Tax=Ceratodon purpureus TaxID=3225 RepID=A0A8T0JC14_CERPU|nr:hypothetical protein KC19_1G264300 [Ceratodon purpureus]